MPLPPGGLIESHRQRAPSQASGLLDTSQFDPGRIQSFFADNLHLLAKFTRLSAWVQRVMSLDS